MKHSKLLLLAALAAASALPSSAQENVDYKKYPDFSTRVKADRSLLSPMTTSATTRPDHLNNADSIYFPPIINQAGGSCGSASRIAYMFTYEINRLRGLDGSLDENRYPTHFTWLLTNSNSGKDGMAIANGIPNIVTYGGPLFSYLFGNQDTADPDFGWMQGYDKWYSAMFNRLERTANFPLSVQTEAGREAVKNWLWNHNGNPDYPGGGICGIGVASGGKWLRIPKTEANESAGVTGQYYVGQWGATVDHALTIVGYDDRIEFDLDGNGVAGEKDKDEVGAWIIANSWGEYWCNNGFIYCPYKHAVTTTTTGGYYSPEIYYIRRNYRPLRTIKIKMDYSKRSELKLSAGISADLSATAPTKTTEFEHFKYAGDGDGNGVDAETPMLGRWADGVHTEPMEFGYDLTDLSNGFDTRRPLKYFFIIESKGSASGTGTIHDCSILDYEFDTDGIEVPFDLGDAGVSIQNKGKKTIISVTVAGEPFNAPRNLMTGTDGILTWDAPSTSSYTLKGYDIYCGNTVEARVGADVTAYTPKQADGIYRVAAVYTYGSAEVISKKTEAPVGKFYGTVPEKNYIRSIANSGFTIKDIFKENRNTATIEYWLRPNSLTNWNQSVGPGWSSNFQIHTTNLGELVVGWNTGNRLTSAAKTLAVGKYKHIAVVVDGSEMTAYVDGEKVGSASGGNTGIGGFGDLTFGAAGSNGISGNIDEVRVWSTARTQREIQSMMYCEVADPKNTPGLLVELKFDELAGQTIKNETGLYEVTRLNGTQTRAAYNGLFTDKRELSADFTLPAAPYYTGSVIEPTDAGSANAVNFVWTVKDGDDTRTLNVAHPSFIFSTAGQKTIGLTVTGTDGTTASSEQTIDVSTLPAPEPGFTSATTVPLGERISFVNTTPVTDGCSFTWSMPGAETETASTINAAATYQKPGKHTVTLTVTNATGTRSFSKDITVTNVNPEAAFTANPATIVKGQEVQLLDQSKYAPTSWAWAVSNDAYHYVSNEASPTFTFNDPGTYNVKLDVANEAGNSSVTKQRAIVVCNADAKTGLNFSGAQTVSFKNPINFSVTGGTTIEWWMYAKSNTKTCHQIGGKDFLITTMASGSMRISIGSVSYVTDAGFVVPAEWHHYAITIDASGYLSFYKDGKLVKTTRTPYGSDTRYPNLPETLSLGGTDAPLNAVIDEFRIWNSCLSAADLGKYANSPIDDVAAAENTGKLALYYNFNQNSGNVTDATSNANTGVRAGFGPEGDSWTTSLGVFSIGSAQREDVTAKYMTNYKAPFLHTDTRVSKITLAKDYYELLQDDETSRWKIENAVENNNITTGISVDTGNEDQLALLTKTYQFADRVTDHKLYQTVTLPAGHYVFGVERADEKTDEASYIVVAKGDTLPDTKKLSTDAIASADMSGSEVAFTVYADTEVSLGLVFNTRGQLTQRFNRFFIEKKISNDDFTWTGIDGVTDNSAVATFTPRSGGVLISTGRPAKVTISAVSGVSVFSGVVEGSKFVSLPAGIYITAGHKFIVTAR